MDMYYNASARYREENYNRSHHQHDTEGHKRNARDRSADQAQFYKQYQPMHQIVNHEVEHTKAGRNLLYIPERNRSQADIAPEDLVVISSPPPPPPMDSFPEEKEVQALNEEIERCNTMYAEGESALKKMQQISATKEQQIETTNQVLSELRPLYESLCKSLREAAQQLLQREPEHEYERAMHKTEHGPHVQRLARKVMSQLNQHESYAPETADPSSSYEDSLGIPKTEAIGSSKTIPSSSSTTTAVSQSKATSAHNSETISEYYPNKLRNQEKEEEDYMSEEKILYRKTVVNNSLFRNIESLLDETKQMVIQRANARNSHSGVTSNSGLSTDRSDMESLGSPDSISPERLSTRLRPSRTEEHAVSTGYSSIVKQRRRRNTPPKPTVRIQEPLRPDADTATTQLLDSLQISDNLSNIGDCLGQMSQVPEEDSGPSKPNSSSDTRANRIRHENLTNNPPANTSFQEDKVPPEPPANSENEGKTVSKKQTGEIYDVPPEIEESWQNHDNTSTGRSSGNLLESDDTDHAAMTRKDPFQEGDVATTSRGTPEHHLFRAKPVMDHATMTGQITPHTPTGQRLMRSKSVGHQSIPSCLVDSGNSGCSVSLSNEKYFQEDNSSKYRRDSPSLSMQSTEIAEVPSLHDPSGYESPGDENHTRKRTTSVVMHRSPIRPSQSEHYWRAASSGNAASLLLMRSAMWQNRRVSKVDRAPEFERATPRKSKGSAEPWRGYPRSGASCHAKHGTPRKDSGRWRRKRRSISQTNARSYQNENSTGFDDGRMNSDPVKVAQRQWLERRILQSTPFEDFT